jgi:hypothetical protein
MSNRKDFTDKNTEFAGVGGIVLPKGTTGERPTGIVGQVRFNTTTAALENYTPTGWFPVSVPIPTLATVSGTIYAGVASTLTLTGTNFGIAAGSVRFTASGSATSVTVTPASATSATVTVPSAIFNLSAGTSVDVQFINSDNGVSNIIIKTIVALPTGGTISPSLVAGYRVHTFTSSSNFVVPSGFTATVDYLLVAGGGSGGDDISGGGGAGGMVTGTAAVSVGSYSIVIGAGGPSTIGTEGTGRGNNGDPSSVFGVTVTGGGAGGGEGQSDANSGASGGGGGYQNGAGGSGTSGQGNSGANAAGSTCGGGGGKGGTAPTTSAGTGGAGGAGLQNNFDGNNYYYAGGGGGGGYTGTTACAAGGIGGGGGGVGGYPASAGGAGGGSARNNGTAGATTWGGSNGGKGGNAGANTGSGGGGSSETNGSVFSASGAGGSGICIVRYAI